MKSSIPSRNCCWLILSSTPIFLNESKYSPANEVISPNSSPNSAVIASPPSLRAFCKELANSKDDLTPTIPTDLENCFVNSAASPNVKLFSCIILDILVRPDSTSERPAIRPDCLISCAMLNLSSVCCPIKLLIALVVAKIPTAALDTTLPASLNLSANASSSYFMPASSLVVASVISPPCAVIFLLIANSRCLSAVVFKIFACVSFCLISVSKNPAILFWWIVFFALSCCSFCVAFAVSCDCVLTAPNVSCNILYCFWASPLSLV